MIIISWEGGTKTNIKFWPGFGSANMLRLSAWTSLRNPQGCLAFPRPLCEAFWGKGYREKDVRINPRLWYHIQTRSKVWDCEDGLGNKIPTPHLHLRISSQRRMQTICKLSWKTLREGQRYIYIYFFSQQFLTPWSPWIPPAQNNQEPRGIDTPTSPICSWPSKLRLNTT